MDMATLPVHYYKQANAWMDANVFENWFHNKFVPSVKKYCNDNNVDYKVLLLIDNAPAHPSEEVLKSRDGKVVTRFLPPNTTSVIQPMDQGILVGMKRRYKKFLLRHLILEDQSSPLSVPDILKQLTIKDAVYWSAKAWDEITVDNLKKGWNQLFSTTTTSDTSINTDSTPATSSNDTSGTDNDSSNDISDAEANNADFYGLFNYLGYSESGDNWQIPEQWLEEDANDPGYQLLSDDEIVTMVRSNEDTSDTESDSDTESQPPVSHAEAFNAFSTALKWLE